MPKKEKRKERPKKGVKLVRARWVAKEKKEKTKRVSHQHVSGLNIEDKPSKPGVYMEYLHCIITESHFVLNLKCKAFKFFHYGKKF